MRNGSIKALVIDDNWDIGVLVGRILEHEHMEAVAAPGGPEGLEMLASNDLPDVVLLDVQMPGMDGWETLEAIRENPRTADIPVIMCTVKGSAIDILRALQLGCDGYVGKPFDIDQLVDEVRCVAARPPSEREAYRSRRLAEVREIVKDDSGAK